MLFSRVFDKELIFEASSKIPTNKYIQNPTKKFLDYRISHMIGENDFEATEFSYVRNPD